MASSLDAATPTTLHDLLSNSLLLRQITPYLPTASLFALARVSRDYRNLVYNSPDVFRYLDLSTVKSAVIANNDPIDSGGISWRAERMDEALTEDEFYSGPILGIFSKLSKPQRNILQHVHTLVLDGLSVPADLVREIVAEDRFSVRILSIREAEHLNERKLQQVLRYAVRPTRPAGTPRLKGLYIFGAKEPGPVTEPVSRKKQRSPPRTPEGVLSSLGAQIGAEWNQKSSDALNSALACSEHKWYQSAGRVLHKRPSAEWAETLKACEGIIFFDAVLCRGPRHDIDAARTVAGSANSFLPPAMASIALGPSGCQSCHTCPETPAMFGRSPPHHLPLLAPPPLHSSTIKAAQRPSALPGSEPPKLFVRCEDCLRGRWCERCNKWWDESCYIATASTGNSGGSTLTAMQQTEVFQDMASEGQPPRDIKKIGVKRECFGCGPTCADCKALYIRACRTCRNEYCIVDNDGSSATACDWCNYSGRRTRELY